MEKVLFICVHNSARSQMAEAYLHQLAGDRVQVASAGFEPTHINPLVIEVMQEDGIDLSAKNTQSAFDLFKKGAIFTHVITVCDDSQELRCPVYPGLTHRLHLPFPDPANVTGTYEEQLQSVREIRDAIKTAIKEFADWLDRGAQNTLGDAWQRLPRG
ncbi:MAG: arsenate reductase ArsC [Thermodesulfobacteriota bacterium]